MDETEKLLKTMSDMRRELAEAVHMSTIGKVVCDMLADRDSISLEGLIGELESRIANSNSARGSGNPDFDIDRLSWEAAINELRSLRSDAG